MPRRRLRRDKNWCRSRRRALHARRRRVLQRWGRPRKREARRRREATALAAKEFRDGCDWNWMVRRARTCDVPRLASGRMDRLRFITESYELLRLAPTIPN